MSSLNKPNPTNQRLKIQSWGWRFETPSCSLWRHCNGILVIHIPLLFNETTWQYGIIRDLHRIGLRGRLPVFVSEYLRDRRIRVRIGNTLSDEFYPKEGVPTGGVLAVTCFGLKIKELPSLIGMDIYRALFVDDLAICFRRLAWHHRKTSTAGSKCHTGMGNKEWVQVCSP